MFTWVCAFLWGWHNIPFGNAGLGLGGDLVAVTWCEFWVWITWAGFWISGMWF